VCFQYLNAVRAHSKKIGAANAAPKGTTGTVRNTAGRKGGKGSTAKPESVPALPNVFDDKNDDDDPTHELLEHSKTGVDDSLEEGVLDELTKLDEALTKCPSCGKDKFCKINKFGIHVNLTSPQRSAWATALVIVVF
jgi:hypothetical protein